MKINVNDLFLQFKDLPEVEAIALGGSRATGRNDETSDYDVYIYVNKPIEENVRRNILSQFCKYMEISNTFWELEDDVTLKDNIDMDIIYRNFDDFKNTIESVVDHYVAYNGYTTCMWHNLITSKIVFDKTGRLTKLKERYSISYPKQLKENIIRKNLSLLSGMLPSFDKQIKKAEERNDLVSVNHRVTEFLASYFDIIFALNEMTHPGEKRMQSICSSECKILPKNFDENLNKLFNGMFKIKISPIVNDIYSEIRDICSLK
jgi:predicted nucleotidyltransferase